MIPDILTRWLQSCTTVAQLETIQGFVSRRWNNGKLNALVAEAVQHQKKHIKTISKNSLKIAA
jgi:hypothetical protein